MIAGTAFVLIDWDEVEPVLQLHRKAASWDLPHVAAQCRAGRAVCVISPDADLIVFELRPQGDELEAFIRLGVGHQHGAWDRSEAAIMAIAHDMGATSVAFRPVRCGWGRRLGAQWVQRGPDFVRRVEDGQERR